MWAIQKLGDGYPAWVPVEYLWPEDHIAIPKLSTLKGNVFVVDMVKYASDKDWEIKINDDKFTPITVTNYPDHLNGTDELIRRVIRHRFLDPDASAQVIAQKLCQSGFAISNRSVERVIAEYGLQKKTLSIPSS